jgi:hypothetical protein
MLLFDVSLSMQADDVAAQPPGGGEEGRRDFITTSTPTSRSA